ncbi:hypothetical protein ASE66_16190 [Bosea sp. Root483D1]|uniref:S8 family serine peptidase n=1 Tax=Bosea sp. Root483D1 TaxID=1736544 RepID=UPI00070BF49F|nr:S8 family serine peptidase [Bosea sp. Root483D1]KRE14862.1 hypothetical protein ASE66_16190 [Bosea sp. Root483D1]
MSRLRLRLGSGLRVSLLGLALAGAPFLGVPDDAGRILPALADDSDGDDGGDGGGGAGGGSSGGGGGQGGGGGSSGRFRTGGEHRIDAGRLLRFFGVEASRPRRAERSAARAAALAVPREIVAAGLTQAELDILSGEGFRVVAQRNLGLLANLTVRLRAPARLSMQRALARVRALAPSALVDLNHLYRGAARPCPEEQCFSLVAQDARIDGACPARGIIGMVDTGVDTEHPALAGRPVETETIRGPGHRAASTQHGTDIAMLLTRGTEAGGQERIIAVDAFHRRGGGDNADSFDLVGALDLLAQRNVRVVNLSLAGPANALVERIGRTMHERGAVLVAAAGNDGPGAEARYPAAYPWAVAVTAIDRDERIYARANRGSHIAFAAPGVRVQLSDKAMRPAAPRSGTSYAAPLVTLAFAQRAARGDAMRPSTLLAALSVEARDLGEPGHDPVFGWGRLSCSP